MLNGTGLWLRREVAVHERRTALVPADDAELVEAGVTVTVEEAPQRAFPIEEYAAVGCRVVPGDTWPDAPPGDFVLGLKEPSLEVWALTHRHIFFGHAYKGQECGADLLRRFTADAGIRPRAAAGPRHPGQHCFRRRGGQPVPDGGRSAAQ